MSVDAFALLGLPPRATLSEETLSAAYHQATRLAHPDREGGDAALSSDLNAAVETLRSPVTRLKHLLEHHSQTPWRAIPLDASLMTLFEKLGPLLQSSQVFLKRKESATTALARALLASEEMALREALEALGHQIEEEWQRIEASLPLHDARLAAHETDAWQDLQTLQARLAYLAKWRAQVREKLLGLML